MRFESLVKNIIKENMQDSSVLHRMYKQAQNLSEASKTLEIINPEKIESIIRYDIEDNWNRFKEKNQMVANITPEYEKRVLSLHKDFLEIFTANFVDQLKKNIFADFYKGKFISAKFKVKYTNIEIVDLEMTKPIIDMAGFALYDFPTEVKGERAFIPYLAPIIQAWRCPNNMSTNMNPWGDFEPEDININWMYSFLAGTFMKEPDINPIEIKRKKFNLDMIPENAYDLLYKTSTSERKGWTTSKGEFYKIIEDLVEDKFEDTIKSQKVGRILSKL